ncbi:hypothetical protein KKE06_01250 [Candidatus Micrarchaeota archaeon]|nr:hypothetical protein [Candidatus Micrarchaeota archaeon]MBU1929962.1 hypothetical protein [Candidatus Micrarchaeota archaeon]
MVQEINKISLLVHPFYSVSSEKQEPPPGIIQKNLSKVLALWTKQVKRAARNPNHLFIIVTPFSPPLSVSVSEPTENLLRGAQEHRNRWYFPELRKFFVFAKKALGKRMLSFNWEIEPDLLRNRIEKRGFRLNQKKLSGSSFGEWWLECLREQRALLIRAIGTSARNFPTQGHLSLTSPADKTRESLGHIRSELKKPFPRARRKKRPVRQRLRDTVRIYRI